MKIWLLFAFLSMFTLAGAELSQRAAMTSKKDISAVTNNFFIWSLQGTAGFIVALLTFSSLNLDSLNTAFWSKLVLLAVLYFIGGTLYYTSYKASNISISIILMSLSSLVSSTLGIIFLHESTNWVKYLGVLLIIIAIAAVRYTKGKQNWSKYNLFALLGGLVYGFTFTLDKSFIVAGISPFWYLGFMSGSVGVVSAILGFKIIRDDLRKLEFNDFYPMFSSAFFGVLFNLMTFFAYVNHGDVGKIDAINNSVVFVVILAEYLFFKERDSMLKKVLASILAFVGMAILAIY